MARYIIQTDLHTLVMWQAHGQKVSEVRIYLVQSQVIASRCLLGLWLLPLSIMTGSRVTHTQTACSVQNTQNFTAQHRGPHLSCRLMLLCQCSSLSVADKRPLCDLYGAT